LPPLFSPHEKLEKKLGNSARWKLSTKLAHKILCQSFQKEALILVKHERVAMRLSLTMEKMSED